MTLIGELNRRDQVVMDLQRLGCVHVLDLSDADCEPGGLVNLATDLKAAINHLERSPEKRPAPANLPSWQATWEQREEAKRIAAEVLKIKSESRLLREEQDAVGDAIEQMWPWGNFTSPEDAELGGWRMYFYRLPHRQAHAFRQGMQHAIAERINRDQQCEYWLVIAPEPPADMPCEPEILDPRSLQQLQARRLEIDGRREQLQVRRIALTRWLDQLRFHLAAVQDETSRMIVAHRSTVDGPVFVLDGWVPRRQIERLKDFANRNTIALQLRKPARDDQPPTLLSNPRPIAGAEGAVTFFMTPAYRAWDPTWVMYFSFAAFFAMILADAGYGIVLALIMALSARPLGRSKSGRQFRQLGVFMVAITIGYGMLIGSFFGIAPPTGSWLDRVVIKSDGRSIMADREAMMMVAATIGVFHLVLANAIVAWRWLGSGHALSSIGWMLGLIGGWLLALAMIPKPDVRSLLSEWCGGNVETWQVAVRTSGWWMLGGGLTLVFLFSSIRPVFSPRPRDWLMRLVDGVMGLTGVTKAFGDALSYLRLFALGLASAQLAIIFNQLASDAAQFKGIGLLLGLLIFLLGHTLNLVLAVVGGVVHGLRLNCIEFFSWSLTDEGQPFQAFEMKAEE
jgi:V/A-type H+-transporting ATPase subunit I